MDRNFARLLDTLSVLQRTRRLSTPEIQQRLAARGHIVSARTVQRDLEQLATVYPLESDQRSRPFTWRWREDSPRLALPAMDWPQALSFYLLSTYLSDVLPGSVLEAVEPYVAEAKRRLDEQFTDLPLAQWPKRVRVVPTSQQFAVPRAGRAVHLTVSEAVLLGLRLRVRYRRFDLAEAKSYVVSPLGLVQHGGVFYVPVRYDGHKDVRTLAMHRIQRTELVYEPSGIEAFNLSRWIAEGGLGFGGQEQIKLVVRLREGAAGMLREAPLSKDQTIAEEGEGVHLVTATTLDTAALRRWLLGLGGRATVLQPSALRAFLRSEHEAALAAYRSPHFGCD